MKDNIHYSHIRCQWCDARLFDTNGALVEPEDNHVEVIAKCWRCRGVNALCLAPGGDMLVAVSGENP